ncbi:MAG: VCBS repeat-containing protein [bacterium]|nr:VCBS repeat-containing protein [bacterium]
MVARTDSGVVFFINKGLGISATLFTRVLIQNPDLDKKPTNILNKNALVLKDFDANGKLDVLVTTPNKLIILVNNSISSSITQSSFQIKTIKSLPYSSIGWTVCSDDLTNDSKPDIVYNNVSVTTDSIFILQNDFGTSSPILDSNSFLGPIISRYLGAPRFSKIEDFNQDGSLDLATSFNSNKLGLQSNMLLPQKLLLLHLSTLLV